MYKTIDQHLSNNNIIHAMGECVRGKFYHLGSLLGRLYHDNDRNGIYNLILGKLESNIVVKNTSNVVDKKQTKIKILCNWLSSKDVSILWNKMSQGNYTWNNLQLVWNEEPDYFVVINSSIESPPPEKTIVFRMEPHMERNQEQWGYWAKPPVDKFIKVCYHETDHNNTEWHVNKTYSELKTMTIQKDPSLNRIMSTVLSSKYSRSGHVKRIDFVKFLEKKGMDIHVFGSNKFEYKFYKGSLPYHCKDDALFPYKYTFNVENESIPNYFTEKIVDGILAECLVFYSGCFNLKEYLPKESFVYLELSNFEEDYKKIQTAINENWWEKRLPYIKKAKQKILDELQFFPRLESIIKTHESTK